MILLRLLIIVKATINIIIGVVIMQTLNDIMTVFEGSCLLPSSIVNTEPIISKNTITIDFFKANANNNKVSILRAAVYKKDRKIKYLQKD